MAMTKPPLWRIFLGFLFAPIAAGFALACFEPLYAGLPDMSDRIMRSAFDYGVIGGYPTALIFGAPMYLWLRNRLKPSLINCSLTGGAVAAAPWLIIAILPSPAISEQTGPHVTVANHIRTIWGWFEAGDFIAKMGGVGLIGGGCFWLVAAAGHRTRTMLRN